ncbi:hypothetical protein [Falsirhodobacter halotolerans]|uniref:hypothetical protein n=1 Tax=Falsirhodobacter halotolerans TaxID=1146892 RepID=UPI001FD4C099|nr:hypothetical protein [Falsirhodobacter halotolerans]MCJ8138588.1 hypothetical protein [Falsirhodobacter halotolerans]
MNEETQTPKKRATRAERFKRRAEAAERLDEIAHHVAEIRRNDEMGSHYTFWSHLGERGEWWPGSQHWTAPDRIDMFGSFDEFVTWLSKEGGA